MRKVKIGKRTAVVAAILVLCVGLAYGAVVNYLSNTITKPVNVESPINLTGEIMYRTLDFGPLAVVPTIDGVISDGEWDRAVEIPVAGDMGIVRVLADVDYLYVLIHVKDDTDAREGENIHGNDQTSININPTEGAPWGLPCDIIFQMGADPAAWGGVSSGETDDWETDWKIDGVQQGTLPTGLETKTIYEAGMRISEWKLPLATIAPSYGDTLKFGGSIDVGDGNSYVYPVGLEWSDVSTYFHLPVGEPIVVTESFGDGVFSEQVYGGSEFFMHFEAENLANNPVDIATAMVIEGVGVGGVEDIYINGEYNPLYRMGFVGDDLVVLLDSEFGPTQYEVPGGSLKVTVDQVNWAHNVYIDHVKIDAQNYGTVITGSISNLDLGTAWPDTAYLEIGLRPEATKEVTNAGIYMIVFASSNPDRLVFHMQDYTGHRPGGFGSESICVYVDKEKAQRIDYKITLIPSTDGKGGKAYFEIWDAEGSYYDGGLEYVEYGYSTGEKADAKELDEDFSEAYVFYDFFCVPEEEGGVAGKEFTAFVGPITVINGELKVTKPTTLQPGASETIEVKVSLADALDPTQTYTIRVRVVTPGLTIEEVHEVVAG